MLRVLRAELRAKKAEQERDLIADVAARAMDRLSDEDLVQLRAELTGEVDSDVGAGAGAG
jgi:hypothetical protein